MSVPPASTYLEEEFDAWSLKVAQLRSILLEHGVPYASNAKKADLIDLFVDNVYSQRNKLLKKGKKETRSSGRGIVLVPTPSVASEQSVESESPPPEPKKVFRKSRSRKSLAVPVPEEAAEEIVQVEEDPTEPPPKRRTTRRSSVTPAPSASTSTPPAIKTPATARKGRASRVAAAPVAEGSESEIEVKPDYQEEMVTIPVKLTTIEKAASRRKSAKVELPETDESGFSDFNPFQSGGEESKERKVRRKSSLGVSSSKRRQSELPRTRPAADSSPEPSSPAAPPRRAAGRKSLPASLLSERISPAVDSLRRPPQEWVQAHAAGDDGDAATVVGDDAEEDDDEDMVVMDPQPDPESEAGQGTDEGHGSLSTDEFEAKNQVISRKLQQIVPDALSAPLETTKALARRARAASGSFHPTALVPASRTDVVSTKAIVPTLSTALLLLALFFTNWTQTASQIGFCDTLSNTNVHLLQNQAAIASARECAARHANGEELGGEVGCDASALPLIPFLPKPETCTPCPAHASCLAGQLIGCDKEYILSTPVVRSIAPALAQALNGVPGLGSVAFPPSCVPDTEKLRLVGGLARNLEGSLAAERGEWVCRVGGYNGADIGREHEFGLDVDDVKTAFLQRRDPAFTEEQFSDIFDAAIEDLVVHGDVLSGFNEDGGRWLAGARSEMTLACRGKLAAKDRLDAWKKELGGVAGVLALAAYLRSKVAQKTEDNKRVQEIVQTVLSRLQDQAQLHFVDPVQAPGPYIAPAHLRDSILASETSQATRERLWAGVEKAVGKNANVRTSEAEVQGEVWRVWQWVGVLGRSDADYQ